MNYCRQCQGELVSCDCDEITEEDYAPEEYLAEDIDDRAVVWVVADNGVGRVEVQQ